MLERSARTPSLLLLVLTTCAASVLASSCGDDDGASLVDGGPDTGPPAPDSGPPCTSDGTPLGDCMRFDCELRKASAIHCAGSGSMVTFNCTGIEAFPADYIGMLTTYFTDCAAELPGLEDTEVETMGGPVTITSCQILDCANDFLSQRSPAPMVIRAECAPVPSPACDLPDPPMP
ncbi:MAG: hypothetical protein IT379_41620 [Deltaproteobacteria bacterium]|nr:hypothetical protein [Deltaproteobacteria bacterium]